LAEDRSTAATEMIYKYHIFNYFLYFICSLLRTLAHQEILKNFTKILTFFYLQNYLEKKDVPPTTCFLSSKQPLDVL
jgi:hypothetical protein